jgi:hypothetical protein
MSISTILSTDIRTTLLDWLAKAEIPASTNSTNGWAKSFEKINYLPLTPLGIFRKSCFPSAFWVELKGQWSVATN